MKYTMPLIVLIIAVVGVAAAVLYEPSEPPGPKETPCIISYDFGEVKIGEFGYGGLDFTVKFDLAKLGDQHVLIAGGPDIEVYGWTFPPEGGVGTLHYLGTAHVVNAYPIELKYQPGRIYDHHLSYDLSAFLPDLKEGAEFKIGELPESWTKWLIR